MIYLVGAITVCLGAGYNCIFAKRKPTACEHTAKEVAKCVFCTTTERGKGVVESQQIAAGKTMRLLIDNSPIIDGHLLLTTVVDKKKAHELTDGETLQEHRLLKQAVAAAKTKYNADSYFLIQKNGKRAGESVPHYHKHIFPVVSKEMFAIVKRNFALKFVGSQLGCVGKLQGERLAVLKKEWSALVTSDGLEVAEADKASDKKDGTEGEEKKPEAVLAQINAYEAPIEPGHVVITTTNTAVKFAHRRSEAEVLACHHLLQRVVAVFQKVYGTDDYILMEENADGKVQKDGSTSQYRMHLYPVPREGHAVYRQISALVKYNYGLATVLSPAEKAAVEKKFATA